MISPVKIWRRQKELRTLLGKKGTILTWTVIYTPGSEFKRYAPFPVAVVKLDSGERITASLVDCAKEDLKIGNKVKVVLRKIREGDHEDVLVYGIKLKPI